MDGGSFGEMSAALRDVCRWTDGDGLHLGGTISSGSPPNISFVSA
jgi:hypothetical protein